MGNADVGSEGEQGLLHEYSRHLGHATGHDLLLQRHIPMPENPSTEHPSALGVGGQFYVVLLEGIWLQLRAGRPSLLPGRRGRLPSHEGTCLRRGGSSVQLQMKVVCVFVGLMAFRGINVFVNLFPLWPHELDEASSV